MFDPALRGLRAGRQELDIWFRRDGAATRYEVLAGDAAMVRLRPMTWDIRRPTPAPALL
ncbi:MAG: hypothetical protein KGM42_16085 [Hyphomicrobiales bacterium]|nr:hypothetical protein [Hyphomicrobiales bacterium]